MSKLNHISFEDWIRWNFDRAEASEPSEAWYWTDEFQDEMGELAWLDNTRLLNEHMTRLFRDPLPVLAPYSINQIGIALWTMFMGGSTDQSQAFHDGTIPIKRREDLFRCLPDLCIMISKDRLPADVRLFGPGGHGGPLTTALYMFWDINPSWPNGTSNADKRERALHFEIMKRTLRESDHSVCHLHALHGLGHWTMLPESRSQQIIGSWLRAEPRITGEVREYAMRARVGQVQ